jgi:hypothetical protein
MAEQIQGRWSEMGSPEEPGEYLLRGRYKVHVRRQDIELAEARGPDVRFTASRDNYLSDEIPFLIAQITSE